MSDATRRGSRIYVGVYGALMFATVITVGVSLLHLSLPAAVGLAVAIALVKAALVARYFMHLKWEGRVIHGAVALTLVLLVALIALVVASMSDQVGVLL